MMAKEGEGYRRVGGVAESGRGSGEWVGFGREWVIIQRVEIKQATKKKKKKKRWKEN